MALHVISGASAAARLDSLLDARDGVLLLENARVRCQDGNSNLDPVAYTEHLGRQVVCGRIGRDFEHPKELKDVESVRRGDPVVIWSARNLDDSLLSLWLFSYLDRLGYPPSKIAVNQIFYDGGPVSSVEQLNEDAFKQLLRSPRWMSSEEASLFRDRWDLMSSGDPTEFQNLFAFDYSTFKGWQDVLLTVLRRLPLDCYGHAPEAVALFECLRLAEWQENAAVVQYFIHSPFEPSKLRLPDAKELASVLRNEAEKLNYRIDSMASVVSLLKGASDGISRFCVPFFWNESLRKSLPPGVGARVVM